MTDLSLVLPLVIVIVCTAGTVAVGGQEVYFGKGVYLPDTDLESDLHPLRQIFEGNLTPFLQEVPYITKRNDMKYLQTSESVLQELGTTFSIKGPVKLLELSFDTSFKRIAGSDTSVNSSLVLVESYSKKIILDSSHYWASEDIPLRQDFLDDLKNLPQRPTLDHEWLPFKIFLQKWGSHYIREIYYGSWLREWSAASSSKSYTSREIKASACAGLTKLEVLPDIKGCLGFSLDDMKKALLLDMHHTTEARGGDPATAAALLLHPTEELVEKFIEQGSTSNQAVKYYFVPVWLPVLARYPPSETSKERKVAMSLQAYYEGFLGFGCPNRNLTKPHTIMQQFRWQSNRFQCVRQCVGCRQDKDCNLGLLGGGCFCYGTSCIVAEGDEKRASVQTKKDNLAPNQLPNRSCFYDYKCYCEVKSKESNCGPDNLIPIWDQLNDSHGDIPDDTSDVPDETCDAVAPRRGGGGAYNCAENYDAWVQDTYGLNLM